MKTNQTRCALALLLLAAAAAPFPSIAQKLDAGGIGRSETVRHDFDKSREAIQVKVDFAPHAAFPKHSHPGVEIAYVLKGAIEYELNGKSVVLKTGDALYIPAGTVHSARNNGASAASELATYIVDKDKPILVIDQSSK